MDACTLTSRRGETGKATAPAQVLANPFAGEELARKFRDDAVRSVPAGSARPYARAS